MVLNDVYSSLLSKSVLVKQISGLILFAKIWTNNLSSSVKSKFGFFVLVTIKAISTLATLGLFKTLMRERIFTI